LSRLNTWQGTLLLKNIGSEIMNKFNNDLKRKQELIDKQSLIFEAKELGLSHRATVHYVNARLLKPTNLSQVKYYRAKMK
jgi:hypothetical protein